MLQCGLQFGVTHTMLNLQLSNSTFLGRSTGSLRRSIVSSSREALTVGNESDPARSRTTDASPGTINKISSGQRSSPLGRTSDPKQASSGKNNSSIKNYETSLKGIESLQFDEEERVHH